MRPRFRLTAQAVHARATRSRRRTSCPTARQFRDALTMPLDPARRHQPAATRCSRRMAEGFEFVAHGPGPAARARPDRPLAGRTTPRVAVHPLQQVHAHDLHAARTACSFPPASAQVGPRLTLRKQGGKQREIGCAEDAPMRWGLRFGVALACLVIGLEPARGAGPGPAVTLRLGQARFWDRGHVIGTSAAPFTWPLRLAANGARLRVAIDTPFARRHVHPRRHQPEWCRRRVGFQQQPVQRRSIRRQADGRSLDGPRRARRRDRCAVPRAGEAEQTVPPMPPGKVAVLPNLKAVPPMEFGFIAPANPLNGLYPPDTINPRLDIRRHPPDLLRARRIGANSILVGLSAKQCLRLTSGPINVGSGPFDIDSIFVGDLLEGKAAPNLANITNTVTGKMQQAVHYSDRSVQLRPAGEYSFHTTHGHFHTDQVLTYELLKVTARSSVDSSHKAPAPSPASAQQISSSVSGGGSPSVPPGTFGEGDSAAGGTCSSPSDSALGLTVGWGDVYRWQRPGQFVEFGGSSDGLYVVRSTVKAQPRSRGKRQRQHRSTLVRVDRRRRRTARAGAGR